MECLIQESKSYPNEDHLDLPTYYGTSHLVKTLTAIQARTFDDFETVVLDDSFGDGAVA